MKLGLLTAAFPSLSLEEVARWARDNGFDALEIACWPSAGGERRRYAGVAHVDVEDFDPRAVRALIGRESGADLSALDALPNVHRLGEVPYARLPEYLAAFDVCTLDVPLSVALAAGAGFGAPLTTVTLDAFASLACGAAGATRLGSRTTTQGSRQLRRRGRGCEPRRARA